MDSRIGTIDGEPPIYTISGLPLPERPYPTTIYLDREHYVVVDATPLVNVESELAVLKEGLALGEKSLKKARKSAEVVEKTTDETPVNGEVADDIHP